MIYGVLGYPLKHSWSADYFNEKFEKEGINATFKGFEYECLEPFLKLVADEKSEIGGFSVTMPYKELIISYLDSIDDVAMTIGAVNCVRVDRNVDGRAVLRGYNTDVVGFIKSFTPNNNIKKAIVFGTGGASKAVCYALKMLGFEVAQISRNRTKYGYKDVDKLINEGYINLINATPIGMYPNVNSELPLPWDLIGKHCYIYDLVYNPLQTKLLGIGAERGATIKNGLEMLHIQAEEAWKIFSNGIYITPILQTLQPNNILNDE